ncbi:MAG: flagellar basal-body rod protein FlgC [Herminiimonas sp.]|jgi:flagellar basal-body rod protein FlgC|nr:flagellar basal-body rod protein FlgC [Herminiimonas sp.]
MDYLASFAISGAGMAVEKLRADLASANLANIHTTRGADGKPYRALRLVGGMPPLPFAAVMNQSATDLRGPQGWQVASLDIAPRMAHEPGHPHADDKGMVAYPAINVVTEMLSVMTATRAYQANVAALNAARSIALAALDIGGAR